MIDGSYNSGFGKNDNIYFAAQDPITCAGILLNKAQSFFTLLSANAYLEKMKRMWRALTIKCSVNSF